VNSKRFLLLGMVAIMALGQRCELPVPGDNPPATQDIELDEGDNGSTILAPVSSRIIVTLVSNASTGYQWELGELDQSILENTDWEFVPPDVMMPGAPGSEIWEFTARSAATTTLRLEYRRPWESQQVDPADTFTVTVTVQ